MHGSFFWYDVMTTDTKAAQKFYTEVIGWGVQPAGPDYTILSVDGQGVAGLMPIPEDARKTGARPCWMGYVAVDDVDKTAAHIQRTGGKIMREPTDIPRIIRFAVVADPQGAGFLIAKGSCPMHLPRSYAQYAWHRGLARALHYGLEGGVCFYEQIFGWTKADAIDMGPMGTYQLFATGSDAVGGMMNKPAEIPVPFWGYYFNVATLDAAIDRAASRGAKVLSGPMEVPGGMWIANCMDPQKAAFSMVAPKR